MPLPIVAAGVLGTLAASFVRYFVGYAIVRVVVALGISLVSYAVIDTIGDFIKNEVQSNFSSAAGGVSDIAAAFGIYAALNIIISAYVGAITIRQVFGAFNRITYSGAGGGQ